MIVLDTHAWVWWVASPERLSPSARQRIDEEAEKAPVLISSISAWEVLGATLITRDQKLQDYPHLETFW